MGAANGDGRNCEDCGLPLSRYNPDAQCQSCLRSGVPQHHSEARRRRVRENGSRPQADEHDYGTGTVQRGKSPNLVLRRIREAERNETRSEFAEAMARVARELGESVAPSERYVARLEDGDVSYPHPSYRRVLTELCKRPMADLGFTRPQIGRKSAVIRPASIDVSLPGIPRTNESGPPVKVTNVTLRGAIMASGLELSQIARKVGVDPKSVQRWITRGVVPHPRHRWKTCEILGCDENELWPEAASNRQSAFQPEVNQQCSYESLLRPVVPAIEELCAVLTDYGFGLSSFTSLLEDKAPSIKDLERDLEIAFNAYQQSRFATAASRVSTLLADTQSALRECRLADRARLLRILALSYQAAASVLSKSGQPDISWIAAERGLSAAEASGIPAVRGSLIRSVAFALLSTGRLEAAIGLVEAGATELESQITQDDIGLSVYGTLFLAGSMAAARFGDGPKTAEYLREAGTAANRLGRDANYLWTAFGPTNVAIHNVNTAVELGDIQTVLNYGLSLNTDTVPMERRVRYLLDVARTHCLTGNRDDALTVLITAERLAPEQVHQHHLTRKVITTLMETTVGRPSIELGKMAARINVRNKF
jgi:transcriptional regulator with XRE-family HTH domain